MHIDDVNRSARDAGVTGSVRETTRSRDERAKEVSSAPSTDQVEISEEGRALAEQAESLSPEVLSEIRGRIEDGVYDAPELAEEVARRILDSDDLGL